MKTNNRIVKLEDHINKEYGMRGTEKREQFEQGFEAFKLGVIIQEMRKEKNMTQEQLAQKCGITKNFVSKIENHASEIKLSTLMHIISEGLGGQLKLSVA